MKAKQETKPYYGKRSLSDAGKHKYVCVHVYLDPDHMPDCKKIAAREGISANAVIRRFLSESIKQWKQNNRRKRP